MSIGHSNPCVSRMLVKFMVCLTYCSGSRLVS